jgi:hypothetical protein
LKLPPTDGDEGGRGPFAKEREERGEGGWGLKDVRGLFAMRARFWERKEERLEKELRRAEARPPPLYTLREFL